MTSYLATYAYDDGGDGGAGYIGLYDRVTDAVGDALRDYMWRSLDYMSTGWYRVDVYRYDGASLEDYEAYEDCSALDRGEDGDVLHLDTGM